MSDPHFVITAPAGTHDLVASEIAALGVRAPRIHGPLVEFRGTLHDGLRVCLWSRVASRVLLEVARAEVDDGAKSLYRAAREVLWREYLDVDGRFAVDCSGRHPILRDARLAALRVKDAIADQFRDALGARPDVDARDPDLRAHVLLAPGGARICVSLGGAPLGRRGYRAAAGTAPLRENVAAALLARARWDRIAGDGGDFLDPMCGSGTLAIEAALIASNVAPGLNRSEWGFQRWKDFDATVWATLRAHAESARRTTPGEIHASDNDPEMVRAARLNAAAAGVDDLVTIERQDLAASHPRAGARGGLLATNAPYGERLGTRDSAEETVRGLAATFGREFAGWHAAVLTATPHALGGIRGWRRREHRLPNARIGTTLVRLTPSIRTASPPADRGDEALTADGEMLRNRLTKRLRTLARWARRGDIGAYRLYDADLPEFAFAIDVYEGEQRWAHVQEYAPPATVDPRRAAARRRILGAVLPDAIDVAPERCVWKRRRRQRGADQYRRERFEERLIVVRERGLELSVNLHDRIDTGLYPDQREIRARIAAAARDRDFLNLFAYTGTASVHAAAGGARSTLAVDLSKHYRAWGEHNLALNGFGAPAHRYETADCIEWLRAGPAAHGRFGLIYLGAPTFSNSARMRTPLDLQRDHVALIEAALRLLEPDGLLLFASHARRLKLDPGLFDDAIVEEITHATVPHDFARRRPPHRCYEIRHRDG